MKASRPQRIANASVLLLGFAFLYLPILLLMIYSFNESRLATVWSGFSTKWYGELFRDRQILSAAWISLKIAFWTACGATVIGTMAALVMTRFHRFPGKTAFGALITAPLVMPEVILGLSLLLMLVSVGGLFGIPSKGVVAIWIAHVTLTLSFVTVVVSSRLSELDRSLEEAAMDLGANRLKVFFLITLPIIAPALVSGWLLAFTLSLDDVVLASFLAGPDSTTLPIKVFSSVRLGLSPKINALATLMILIVSLGVVVGWWLGTRRERERRTS
jgi:putrescine transport system permease protein